jgi:TorA maturation chaperone TorD
MANGQGTVMYKCAEFSSPEEQRAAPHDRGTPDTAESTTVLHRQDAEARGDMYRFLASVYLQPPPLELVQHITDETFLDELAGLFGDDAVAELKAYASAIDLKEEVSLLKQEYMDLFAVPTGRYVTPFEDVYRGIRQDGSQERGPLLGERAITAKILYREAGAQVDQACRELPTHIGVELAFMEFLCKHEAAAIGREEREESLDGEQGEAEEAGIYRRYQMKFLTEHLYEWFPQLSRAILDKSSSQFYRGLAQLTEQFIAMDLGALACKDTGAVSDTAGQPARGMDS